MEKNTGAMGIGTSAVPLENRTPTLSDMNIDKKLSSRAQKLAAVPEDKFENMIGTWRERVEDEGERVTTNLLREGGALEKILKPKAKERQGTRTDLCQKSAQGKTRTQTAKALNIGHDTLYKAKVIARKNPEAIKKIDEGNCMTCSLTNLYTKGLNTSDFSIFLLLKVFLIF